MKYTTVQDVAKKWNIKERRVRTLLETGRIRGAKFVNQRWMIPITAEKPVDRRRNKKNIPTNIYIDDEEYGNGYFGKYGGCFLPTGFKKIIEPILLKYRSMFNSLTFRKELEEFRKRMQFRPTPLYFAENFSKYLGSAGIYIKREDLNYTNSMYINQAITLAYLARYLHKKKMVAECGDANYAVSLAYACNYVGIELELFIGQKDYKKQKAVIDQVKLMGTTLVIVTKGNKTIYDATNSCFQEFLLNDEEYFYCFHDAIGPHPFPTIVEDSQNIVSREVKQQFEEIFDKAPDYVVAPLGIAVNALTMFNPYIDAETKLIVVENTNSIVENGEICQIHGCFSKFVADPVTGENSFETECSGMNYPGISPKLCALLDAERIDIEKVTDEEAAAATFLFTKLEGIVPSFEDGYTLAYIIKLAQKIKGGTILMCLTGSGLKDIEHLTLQFRELQ